VLNASPLLRYPHERDPAAIVHETGWVTQGFWKISPPTGIDPR